MTTSHFLCSKSTTIFQHISLSKAFCKGTEIILFYQTFDFFSISLPFFLKFSLFFLLLVPFYCCSVELFLRRTQLVIKDSVI